MVYDRIPYPSRTTPPSLLSGQDFTQTPTTFLNRAPYRAWIRRSRHDPVLSRRAIVIGNSGRFSLQEETRTQTRVFLQHSWRYRQIGRQIAEATGARDIPPLDPVGFTYEGDHVWDRMLRRDFKSSDDIFDKVGDFIRAGYEWAAYGRMQIYLYLDFVMDSLNYQRCQLGVDGTLVGAIFESSSPIPEHQPLSGFEPEPWPRLLERHGVPVFRVTGSIRERLDTDPTAPFPRSSSARQQLARCIDSLRDSGATEHIVRYQIRKPIQRPRPWIVKPDHGYSAINSGIELATGIYQALAGQYRFGQVFSEPPDIVDQLPSPNVSQLQALRRLIGYGPLWFIPSTPPHSPNRLVNPPPSAIHPMEECWEEDYDDDDDDDDPKARAIKNARKTVKRAMADPTGEDADYVRKVIDEGKGKRKKGLGAKRATEELSVFRDKWLDPLTKSAREARRRAQDKVSVPF